MCLTGSKSPCGGLLGARDAHRGSCHRRTFVLGLIKTRPSRIVHLEFVRRVGAAAIAFTMTAAGVLMFETSAGAAIVPTVPLLTAGNYSVLSGTTVTNTGFSVLNLSLGLSPGTSITGVSAGGSGSSGHD